MKASLPIFKSIILGITLIFACQYSQGQFLKRLKEKVKETAADHVTNDAGNATDKAIDKTEGAAGNAAKGNNNSSDNNSSNDNSNNSSSGNSASSGSSNSSAPPSLKSYKNFDFVPGDSIFFADDFSEDQQGELPAHWLLCYGQGEVNTFDGKNVFVLTAGQGGDHAAVLQPRMKKTSGYMPDAFTVEFDMYSPFAKGDEDIRDPWVGLNFYGNDDPINGYDDWDLSPEHLGFFDGHLYDASGIDLPENLADNNFVNKWHHISIAYRNKQMKIYLDQNRIFVIPQVATLPINKFGIRVSGKAMVTNIRLAEGGGMNMIGKKFTEAKIITHGITFDIDKSEIKPESMGTLNMIVGVLKSNPDLKFEIDGHTDNTGQAAHNLTLSQQRAKAVKAQLVKMGIDGSRLTTKGFGDTKPISDNSTPEGKANNRRVEFVKM
ncbi:MAG TPA: OmpA family protein [Hanamia sp.]|nr:OmpA family protein [Hanamia sp.]